MKKILYTFGIFAFSTLAFSACQKEFPTENNQPEKNFVTVTFSAEKVCTKTAAVEGSDGVSFIWTDNDIANMKLFTVGTEIKDNNGVQTEVEKLTQISDPVITKVSDTKLNISASVEPNATYTFRAVLSGDWTGSGSDYSTRKAKVMATQSPNGIDNFDPNADILVSDDINITVGEEENTTGDMLLSFRRKVVINKMTLKNIGAGEKVSKVVITSANEIQGFWNVDAMIGQGNVITLNYNDVEPSDGLFPVYFVSMPQTGVSLTVDVTTDKNTYSKSFAEGKSIDLNLGQFTKFNVALPAGSPVTTVPTGDYFITGVNNSSVYAAKAYSGGNNLSNPLHISLDEENETIEYQQDIEDCIFTFTLLTEGDYAGKYTIQDANGLYLYAASSSSNFLKGENAPDVNGNAYWTVEKDPSGGTYTIQAVGANTRNIMRFNYNNGTPMFSCYASGQAAVTIYPASWCTLDTTPVLTIDSEERTKKVISDATVVEFNYSANRYASVPVVTVLSDQDGIIAENDGEPAISVADGKITVGLVANTEDKAKTATLSVTSTGLASAVTLTINQEAYVEGGETTYDYLFTSGSWAATINGVISNWTSGKAGGGFTSGQGVQVTTNSTGANATSPIAFTGVSKIVVTYNTNKSAGAGSIKIQVGENEAITQSVAYTSGDGRSANYTVEYIFDTPQDGNVKITVNTTTNSIYIKSIAITAASSGTESGGGDDDEEITETISGTFSSSNGSLTLTTASGITIVQAKGTSTNDVNSTYNTPSTLRMYKGHTLTFSGKTLTKIEILVNSTYFGNSLAVDTGTLTPTTTSGGTIVWEGSATSVTITNAATASNVQLRPASIKVTYK